MSEQGGRSPESGGFDGARDRGMHGEHGGVPAAGQAGPDSGEPRRHDIRQPEYGAVKQPEYGALASQFPPNYDPYIFGHPEAPKKAAQPEGSKFAGVRAGVTGRHTPGQGVEQQPSESQRRGPVQSGPNAAGYQPHMFHGIDLNNPAQNPLYGHWDMYAILALVFAIVSVPVLPAVMGGIAMWRTRMFHMHGFWLGLAAVIINVITTLFSIWLTSQGISMQEVYAWLLEHLEGTSGTSGTVSA